MNFAFLSPFFLIGLAAVALPVVAHLISKKGGVKKLFPSVQFLLASQGEAAKTSRLKDLILLAVRASVLVLLVLVFSKPAVFSFSAVSVQDVKSVAIVIDNSFSMGYGDNFERAKDGAEKLIDSLRDGSFGFVVPLVPTGDATPPVTQGAREMKEDLENIELSYSFADNERRLEEIFGSLKKSPNERKEVILFTDLQKNGWVEGSVQRGWLVPVDVAEGQSAKNHSVSQVKLDDRGDSVGVSVKASNHSRASVKNLLAAVSLGGREIKSFFNIEPGGEEVKEFVFSKQQLAGSEIRGRVEISQDDLTVDDVRYFVLSNVKELRILAVDGDPREDVRLSETYYLTRAVETISEVSPLDLSVKDNDAFLDEDLGGYDLIALANVGDLTPKKAAEIEGFVKGGGTVVIFLGELVRGNVYNALLGNILPAKIGAINEGDYTLSADKLNELTEKTYEKIEEVEEVKVRKLYGLRPLEDSRTILTSSSLPFLVKRQVGKGSAFLFASTPDTNWGDFPITPVFLPTMKKIFDVSLGAQSKGKNFLVGEAVEIEFPDGADEVTVENPSGEELTVYTQSPVFLATLAPGIYTVEDGENNAYSFSVNVDPRESNLEKISLKNNPTSPATQSGLVKVFKEIWSYFLWGAIALFVSESVLRVMR